MAQSDNSKDTAAQENLLSALDSIKRLLEESERKNPLLEKVVEQVEEAHIPVLDDIVVPEPESAAEDDQAPTDEFVFEAPESVADVEPPPSEDIQAAPLIDEGPEDQLAVAGVSLDALRAAVEVLRTELEQRIDEQIEAAATEAASRLKTELATSLDALVEELASSQSPDD
jgi:hypothetical protein